nr:hypothetical protein CFP56_23976 [Quercus suber]
MINSSRLAVRDAGDDSVSRHISHKPERTLVGHHHVSLFSACRCAQTISSDYLTRSSIASMSTPADLTFYYHIPGTIALALQFDQYLPSCQTRNRISCIFDHCFNNVCEQPVEQQNRTKRNQDEELLAKVFQNPSSKVIAAMERRTFVQSCVRQESPAWSMERPYCTTRERITCTMPKIRVHNRPSCPISINQESR